MEQTGAKEEVVETPRSITLKSWLADYVHHKADSCLPNCYPVSDAESDEIDIDAIEKRVKQLMKDIHVTAGFCSRCCHLLQHWPNFNGNRAWDYAVGQTYSTEEIEAASRLGCKLCVFLWTGLTKNNSLSICRKIEARLAALHHPGRSSLTIQNRGTVKQSENSGSLLLWWNYPGKEATHINMPGAWLFRFQSELLPLDTKLWDEAPKDPIEMAKSWLSNCVESHEICRPLKKVSAPSRLVSIANNTMKLVETKSWDEIPQYATLSYCWGQTPFLKLTRKRLPAFLKAIPLESLPKTLQDAIYVARRLGLSFIWIDALCIIQDDEDHGDWRQESGRMNSISGGSRVTISASSSQDVFQGLLPALVPNYSGGLIARVLVGESARVQNFHNIMDHIDSTITTHLGSRSWAFQEKLLSPRTIHIGDHGVYWECRSEVKSQCVPEGLPRSRLVRSEKEEWAWDEIVRIYSNTRRTYGSDILPALSGIAARQHDITGSQYLAGLWKHDLLSTLLWATSQPVSVVERPSWRAPTWSWASVDVPCIILRQISDVNLKLQARLLDAWTKTVDGCAFGAVVDGEITLACSSLIIANLNYTGIEKYLHKNLHHIHSREEMLRPEQRPYISLPGLESKPLPVSLDCLEYYMHGKEEQIYLLPLHEGPASVIKRFKAGPEDEAANSNAGEGGGPPSLDSRGPVSSRLNDGGEWADEMMLVAGLVLRPCVGPTGYYTRIGRFNFSSISYGAKAYQNKNRSFYREAKYLFDSMGEATAKLACIRTDVSEQNPEQKYVITIR